MNHWANRSMEGFVATNHKIGVRISISLPCTYRTMEVPQTSNLLITVRPCVGVLKMFEKHIRYVLPPVKRRVESSNLSSNAILWGACW